MNFTTFLRFISTRISKPKTSKMLVILQDMYFDIIFFVEPQPNNPDLELKTLQFVDTWKKRSELP